MRSTKLIGAFAQEAGTVWLTDTAPGHSVSVEELVQTVPASMIPLVLRCGFEEGGPWAGIHDLFQALLEGIRIETPDLIEPHGYELVHVFPELKPHLGIRNPSLTDIASNDERVRNYPADRALRIAHGLIDLLTDFKERSAQREHEWLLVCLDYAQASNMAQYFFQELMRRRGHRLRISLIADGSTQEYAQTIFVNSVRQLPFSISTPETGDPIPSEEAVRRARVIEAKMGDDVLSNTVHLPELIRLWKLAGRQEKVLEWSFQALHAFNTLGLYRDALRYGDVTQKLLRTTPVTSPIDASWGTFFKLFMSYIGISDIPAALQLAEEKLRDDHDDPAEYPKRIRLCYLVAMLHARFFNPRDYETGEIYLERGLQYLEKAEIEEDDRWFQFVFNRNGLAMIRSFQKRHNEALELCASGYSLLSQHLSPDKHRLHRSVLIYNMAQVYAQIGAYDQAIEHYSAAMEMDPNYSEYYNERGNLLLKMGRLREAENDYRKAISLSPPYFEVWINLGNCYRLSGFSAQAVDAFSRALDLAPDQTSALLGRAQAYQDIGQTENAIHDFSAALQLNPSLWEAFAGRAVLLYEGGNLDGCLEDLNRAVALAPAEAELYQNRAIALTDLNRCREASRDLEEYLRLRADAEDRLEIEARLQALASSTDLPAVSA